MHELDDLVVLLVPRLPPVVAGASLLGAFGCDALEAKFPLVADGNLLGCGRL